MQAADPIGVFKIKIQKLTKSRPVAEISSKLDRMYYLLQLLNNYTATS